jgi:hypothetical protein
MNWVTPDHGTVLKDLHLHSENESTRALPYSRGFFIGSLRGAEISEREQG